MRPLRDLFLIASGRRLTEAWLHHLHALQETDKPLDAKRYLYERLNVIDRKADVILRLNLLSLTFLAIMASVFFREVLAAPPGSGPSVQDRLFTVWVAGAVLSIFLCVVVSSFLAYSISGLRLDYVTSHPYLMANLRTTPSSLCTTSGSSCTSYRVSHCAGNCDGCNAKGITGSTSHEQLASNRPCPKDRRWWATYAADEWKEILAAISDGKLKRRTAYQFDRQFLLTIIARQRMLSFARALTGLALIGYFFMLAKVLHASCIMAALPARFPWFAWLQPVGCSR